MARCRPRCKARGMGHYGESHEGGRAFNADGMEVKKLNDIPMSAMWTQSPGVNKEHIRLQRGRSGVGVGGAYLRSEPGGGGIHDGAAAPWAWSPATLKPTADQELLNGINRFRHSRIGAPARWTRRRA
jgi:hypothetical protein